MDDLSLLKSAFSCIDSTSLNATDNHQTINNFCSDTLSKFDIDKGINRVASLCVYPVFVEQLKTNHSLANTDVHIASVAAAFPSGQAPISLKIDEVRYAVDRGADEVDIVISRGTLLQGDYQTVYDELTALREAASNAILKVILETGELQTDDLIHRASCIALSAGADFIKTSTGKSKIGATPEACTIMLNAIDEHYKQTGRLAGLKVSGGISTPQQALIYARMAYKYYGDQFFNKTHFRIGASSLVKSLFDYLQSSL